MDVETLPIGRVIPYARNPRKNDGAATAKVAESLRQFGWRQPIVVDESMVVIVGHTRLKAAAQLGMAEVPVHIARGLTPEQVQAYRLTDNRVGEEAEWDEALLTLELGDLRDAGMDLALTGFDQDELDELLLPNGGQSDPDEVPALEERPVAVLGEVWVLGKHRIACGDCTDPATVAALLGRAKPVLMVTDPPYGVNYDPAWRNRAGVSSTARTGVVANDDRADWREAWALFPGPVAYVWHAGLFAPVVAASLEACGFELRSQIIWAKERFALSRGHYHWQHEPCWYAVRKGGTWRGDRTQSTLWSISSKAQDSETTHGTQKPVQCMQRPIEHASKAGDAVYEPFSGSGTTIIAAETTGRACLAMELNPLYVDLAIRRWQAFAGATATLEGDGRSFDQVAAERLAQVAA